MRIVDSSTGKELARAETPLLTVIAHGELVMVEADVGGTVTVPPGAHVEVVKGKLGIWIRADLDMPFDEWWDWLRRIP